MQQPHVTASSVQAPTISSSMNCKMAYSTAVKPGGTCKYNYRTVDLDDLRVWDQDIDSIQIQKETLHQLCQVAVVIGGINLITIDSDIFHILQTDGEWVEIMQPFLARMPSSKMAYHPIWVRLKFKKKKDFSQFDYPKVVVRFRGCETSEEEPISFYQHLAKASGRTIEKFGVCVFPNVLITSNGLAGWERTDCPLL